MKIALLVVMLLMTSCVSDTNNWPYRMTPFFAECPYEEGVWVDERYHKKNALGGCKHGAWKYTNRGKPTLNDD